MALIMRVTFGVQTSGQFLTQTFNESSGSTDTVTSVKPGPALAPSLTLAPSTTLAPGS